MSLSLERGEGKKEAFCRHSALHGQSSRNIVQGLLSDSEKLSVARMQGHGEVGMDKWGERKKSLMLKLQGVEGRDR